MPGPRKKNDIQPVLRAAPLGELNVYMVTEEELDKLGQGSPASIFLNFALALLPLSGAFLTTLLTTKIDSTIALVFFVCASLICALIGGICMALFRKTHADTKALVHLIKS